MFNKKYYCIATDKNARRLAMATTRNKSAIKLVKILYLLIMFFIFIFKYFFFSSCKGA